MRCPYCNEEMMEEKITDTYCCLNKKCLVFERAKIDRPSSRTEHKDYFLVDLDSIGYEYEINFVGFSLNGDLRYLAQLIYSDVAECKRAINNIVKLAKAENPNIPIFFGEDVLNAMR